MVLSKGIFVSQHKCILDSLKEIGKAYCKPTDTLIDSNHKLGEASEDVAVDKGNYQRLVGRLIYLSHIWPGIVFAVSIVSQFMHTQNKSICMLHVGFCTLPKSHTGERNYVQGRADTRSMYQCILCRINIDIKILHIS